MLEAPRSLQQQQQQQQQQQEDLKRATTPIPYRAFLRSRPVQALMFTHLTHNWLNYTMLSWLPTYFTDTLSVDLQHAAQFALLPPLASVAISAVAGRMADALIARSVPVPMVRKLAQTTAFVSPALLLSAVCYLDSFGGLEASSNSNCVTTCITLALGLSSFSLAGLYCTHQDLSPKYASAMLGVTNTVASLPGVFGVALVGYLLDVTGSWDVALFAPSCVLLTLSSVVFCLFCSNDPIDFDLANNEPFLWEQRVRGAMVRMAGGWAAMTERIRIVLQNREKRW
jgi:ACS family sodium-dependent inorganic phosphate cotransporter